MRVQRFHRVGTSNQRVSVGREPRGNETESGLKQSAELMFPRGRGVAKQGGICGARAVSSARVRRQRNHARRPTSIEGRGRGAMVSQSFCGPHLEFAI